MRLDKVIAGLQTLMPYYDKEGGGFNVGAEHDVLYAYCTARPLSPADLETMVSLGWFQEEAAYGDGDFGPQHYDRSWDGPATSKA